VLALPGLGMWKRCTAERHVLLRVFSSATEVDAALGLVAWHAPRSKEEHGYNMICPPPPPARLTQPATVPRPGKQAANFMAYDTVSQLLTISFSIARFNGTKRVSGATVGGKPGPGQVYKLGIGWVDRSVRAPTQLALRRMYPSAPVW
jgi:hypothetical protein